MCGGRGTRLDADVEKPLVPVAGVPMVDRVRDALVASRVDDVYAVVSPHTPATRDHVDLPVIEAPGDGYVDDLAYALERVDQPVLTVAADLPLLTETSVNAVLDAFTSGSMTVAVPTARKRRLGVSVDTTFTHEGRDLAPAGVNVVGGGEDLVYVSEDPSLAVNVNRPGDVRVAEELLSS
ncbi:NTP transferase domain-containing protein [Halobacteriaceae archaeon GCM10025711]